MPLAGHQIYKHGAEETCSIFKAQGLRCQCLQWWNVTSDDSGMQPKWRLPTRACVTSAGSSHLVTGNTGVSTAEILVDYPKALSKCLSRLPKNFSNILCSLLSSCYIRLLWLMPSFCGTITPYLVANKLCLTPLLKTLTSKETSLFSRASSLCINLCSSWTEGYLTCVSVKTYLILTVGEVWRLY